MTLLQNTSSFSSEGALRLEGIDRFLFLGGGALLWECARGLKAAREEVQVVTSSRLIEEPLRGANAPSDTLGEALKTIELTPLVVDDASGLNRFLKEITPTTLAVSWGSAWIFPTDWIKRWEGRLLNVHGARLPLDRGGGGFTWQILQENHLGCCLIHQIDGGVDAGPVVKYREFSYPPSCRIPKDYFEVYDQENRRFLAEFFEEVHRGVVYRLMPQPEYLSVYWPRLSTTLNGYIDWSWKAREIERFICAFDDPYAGASTFFGGERVFLKGCFLDSSGGLFHPFQSGIVYRKSKGRLFVAAQGGALVVGKITDEEGRSLYETIRVGDRFLTPYEHLEEARRSRVFYTPKGLRTS